MRQTSISQTIAQALSVVALTAAFTAVGALSAAHAQTEHRFELRPFVGSYIPTGDQKDFLKSSVQTGAQASWRLMPSLAITGTASWAPAKDKISAGDQTVDIYQYDIGAELRRNAMFSRGAWELTPHIGLGFGGRTYDYRDLEVDSKTNVAGYAALGNDLNFGRFGLRSEVRDYISRFEPLTGGGDAKTRNDISLLTAFTVRF